MKHKNKKLRKAEARIEQTGVLGELNISDQEVLILNRLITYAALNIRKDLKDELGFAGFSKGYENPSLHELVALHQKFKRLADYLREIHGKTPAQIAAFNIKKQEEHEAAQAASAAEQPPLLTIVKSEVTEGYNALMEEIKEGLHAAPTATR